MILGATVLLVTIARSSAPRADVGDRVRLAREKADISREELATQARVSFSTIRRIERGYIPRADRLAAIAKALGTTVEELLKPNGEAA